MTASDGRRKTLLPAEARVRNDRARYDRFCEIVRDAVPEAHAAVLRGSAITGRAIRRCAVRRRRAGHERPRFDARGGRSASLLQRVLDPGIHSKPLSDEDPDIAPELMPLRQQLMDMVRRPVNIQGTRDWMQHFRGDIMNQPYLTLFGTVQEP